MFGPEDAFLNQLAALARVMPILPLFGTGAVRLQPVYVNDVAGAVAQALASKAARGKTYELGGPRTYTYKALLQLVLEQIGRRRLLVPVPYAVWELLAAMLAPLPKRPISRDQVVLMKRDNAGRSVVRAPRPPAARPRGDLTVLRGRSLPPSPAHFRASLIGAPIGADPGRQIPPSQARKTTKRGGMRFATGTMRHFRALEATPSAINQT